jgi:hypothetical protein
MGGALTGATGAGSSTVSGPVTSTVSVIQEA